MKRIAIGRINWLFVGSAQGGRTAAVLMGFTSRCQRLDVEPLAYLRDVLTRSPATPARKLFELLLDHWQSARQAKTATSPSPATKNPALLRSRFANVGLNTLCLRPSRSLAPVRPGSQAVDGTGTDGHPGTGPFRITSAREG
jgi:hypothetical protein